MAEGRKAKFPLPCRLGGGAGGAACTPLEEQVLFGLTLAAWAGWQPGWPASRSS